MSADDKSKLINIEPFATANSSDTFLRNRTNHEGTQAINTVSGLQGALDFKEPAFIFLPINKGGTGSVTRNFVDLTSAETISGVKSFSGGSTNLTNPTSNTLVYSNAGLGTPTFNSATLGTKLLLFNSFSSTATSYAVGISSGILWQSIPQASTANKYSWYAGINEIMSLRGDGLLAVPKLIVSSVNAWEPVTFQNAWLDFGGAFSIARYRKLPDGTVELKGFIKKTVVPSPGETIFTLPVGFRPLETRVYAIVSNNAAGRVDVQSSGNVCFFAGNNVWISLEGIRFIAEQ